MFTLYIANKNYSSWSLRAWVLMRELGIPFEEKLFPLGDAAVKEFSPSGRVPCLVDGGTTVWDSLAIAEYLAEQFPKVCLPMPWRGHGRVLPPQRCIPALWICAARVR